MTVVEVADGVLVTTSAIEATTSAVVVRDGAALLVDPAWLPTELVALADLLDDRGLTVAAGFSTHAHHDHLLWHPRFGDVPRWASRRTAELAVSERPALLEHMGPGWPPEVLALFAQVEAFDGERLPEPWSEVELARSRRPCPRAHRAVAARARRAAGW